MCLSWVFPQNVVLSLLTLAHFSGPCFSPASFFLSAMCLSWVSPECRPLTRDIYILSLMCPYSWLSFLCYIHCYIFFLGIILKLVLSLSGFIYFQSHVRRCDSCFRFVCFFLLFFTMCLSGVFPQCRPLGFEPHILSFTCLLSSLLPFCLFSSPTTCLSWDSPQNGVLSFVPVTYLRWCMSLEILVIFCFIFLPR